MPYPNIPTGFALARIRFILDGAQHDPQVIIGYQVVDTTGNADTHCNQLFSNWAPLLASSSNQLTLQDVTNVENVGGVLTEGHSNNTPVVGSSTSAPVPANTSILVHKTTGLIGRHFRGRMYWPGLPTNGTDPSGSSLNSTSVSSLQVLFDTARAGMETLLLPMYLLHRSTVVPPTHVIDLHVEPLLATQSRRLRKVAHR